MRVEYSPPTRGQCYLVDRNAARLAVRATLPELDLLAFQTRRGPNMTRGVPYCAQYHSTYVRILSVEEGLASPEMKKRFAAEAMPFIMGRVKAWRANNDNWPRVAAVLDGDLVEVACSTGGLFPSLEEVRAKFRRDRLRICSWPAAVRKPPLHAQLQFLEHETRGHVVSLGDEAVILGTHRDCALKVKTPTVRRHHARIYKEAGAYWVEALKQAPVLVNDVEIERHRLAHRDRISCGSLTLDYFER
jgi:hypothetical protein